METRSLFHPWSISCSFTSWWKHQQRSCFLRKQGSSRLSQQDNLLIGLVRWLVAMNLLMLEVVTTGELPPEARRGRKQEVADEYQDMCHGYFLEPGISLIGTHPWVFNSSAGNAAPREGFDLNRYTCYSHHASPCRTVSHLVCVPKPLRYLVDIDSYAKVLDRNKPLSFFYVFAF